jgi:nitroreductase
MELKDMIWARRSVRKYVDEPLKEGDLRELRYAFGRFKPLYPGIRVRWEILEKEQVRFYIPWKSPQLMAIYSEKKEGYLENVGFLFQQMDLYLQSIGLGSCWVGLGKPRHQNEEDGAEFVVLLAFGTPQGTTLRIGSADFKRKTLAQIADRPDPALEPARLAPSSTNSQPWFFAHEEDAVHAYMATDGLRRHTMIGTMNRIDMGIALAHMYVANEDRFRFFCVEAPRKEGYQYIGSFTL